MRPARTSLLVKFSRSTSVAALVLTFTCGSPGVVLAEVDVLTPAVQTAISPEGTAQIAEIRGDSRDNGFGSVEGSTMPATTSSENAQGEAVSIAEDQTR